MSFSWLSFLSNVSSSADIPRPVHRKAWGSVARCVAYGVSVLLMTAPASANELCPVGHKAPWPDDKDRPPNIVLVAVDTLRADRLGFYGHDRETSPHLDRLAADAWVYERAVAPAPWTTPSFAGILTGRSPGSLGISDRPVPLPREVETLAEGLQEAGYATAGIVSHLFVGRHYGFSRGFDFWDQRHAKGHAYISSKGVSSLGKTCLDSLVAADRPFFLFTHFFDPHYDFISHRGHAFGEPYEGTLRIGSDNFEQLRRLARQGRLSADDRRHLFDRYDSEIAYTDAHIGSLMRELKRRNLYDDTVIVLIADHGEMLGERDGRVIGHTQYLYEELVRVPFLLKLAGTSHGRGRVEEVVGLLDLTPTLLGLAGISGEDSSRSLVPDRQGRVPRRHVFSQTRRWRRLDAIYDGIWKLVIDQRTGRRLLFDLSRDLSEGKSLHREEAQRVRRLEKILEVHLAEERRAAESLAGRSDPELTPEQRKALKALGYGG